MDTIIVAFGYKKQVGKDTGYKIVEKLANQRGIKINRIAFADPLKREILRDFFKVPENNLDFFEKNKLQIRSLMQAWGDGKRNFINPNYWTSKAIDEIKEGYLNIFTDMRYPNEKEVVDKLGGTTIEIIRDTGDFDSHASETSLNGVEMNFTIENNGTLEEFEIKIRDLFLNHIL